MEYYLVYGDGCDYIVVDGIWMDEESAKQRAQFLNGWGDNICENYLCLDWTWEKLPLRTSADIKRNPKSESGWVLQ